MLTPAECGDKHTRIFLERHQDVCANKVVNWRQFLFYMVLCPALLLIGFLRDYKIAYTVLTFSLCAMYGAVIFFRLISVALALLRTHENKVTPEEVAALQDEDLPIYTVLVPMYKEPEVAQKIARTVTSLNYPLSKLDVKLLLEEDDAATRAKIDEVIAELPPCVEVIIAPIVPKGQPRTKPRACNWGLEKAKGKFLVVFDAEDQPEPDQLKKSIVVFRRLEAQGNQETVCLQAKLNYFNARQNALTRFFTLEYTNWFDLFLPGLHAVRTPIPLGGTSNHFKTAVLKDLHGWDPFNVTEDCDLGIRLARQGYATEVLDSTTWEEANSQVPNWIRQRSRWIKGYFQTHLVHTRTSVLPNLLFAAIFFALFRVLSNDLKDNLSATLRPWAMGLKFLSLGFCALSAGMAGYSLYERITQQRRRAGEAHLGFWKALTFRFTVGGLSLMLLLNMVFWIVTGAYVMREPLAAVMPRAISEIRVDETTRFGEALREWKLYYTNVYDERYAGTTVWNTTGDFLTRRISSAEASERMRAIDTWSLISQLFYPVALMLFVANLVFVALGLVSCQKRGLWDLFPFALLVPFYWVLISIAAYKGFIQLFTNPWYWEKTTHGLTHSSPPQPPQPPVQQVETPMASS